jgi:predicted Zn-dependent protease
MATGARNLVIQGSYHGAAGAAFMYAQNYAAAIDHLQEDQDDPSSMEMLARAYQQVGATDKQHEIEVRLRGTYLPTLEQALVVPASKAQSSLTLRPTL